MEKEKQERRDLRVKITSLSKKHIIPNCERYLRNVNQVNSKIIVDLFSPKTLYKQAKKTINFHYNLKKNEKLLQLTDTDNNFNDFKLINKTLKKELSESEVRVILKDKNYFIQNEDIKEKLPLFKDIPLYKIITEEEKKEAKKILNKKITTSYFIKRFPTIYSPLKDKINEKNVLSETKETKKISKVKTYINLNIDLNTIDGFIEEDIKTKKYNELRSKINKIKYKNIKLFKSKNEQDKLLNNFYYKSKDCVYSQLKKNDSKIYNNNIQGEVKKLEKKLFPNISSKNLLFCSINQSHSINNFKNISLNKKKNLNTISKELMTKRLINYFKDRNLKRVNTLRKLTKLNGNLNESELINNVNKKIKESYLIHKNEKRTKDENIHQMKKSVSFNIV